MCASTSALLTYLSWIRALLRSFLINIECWSEAVICPKLIGIWALIASNNYLLKSSWPHLAVKGRKFLLNIEGKRWVMNFAIIFDQFSMSEGVL